MIKMVVGTSYGLFLIQMIFIENALNPYITPSALVNTEMSTLVSLIKFIVLLVKYVHSVSLC